MTTFRSTTSIAIQSRIPYFSLLFHRFRIPSHFTFHLLALSRAMTDLGAIHTTLSALTAGLQQLANQLTSGVGQPQSHPVPAPQAPVPVLPTPPVTSYTSARAHALPPSSQGHPVPASLLGSVNQPMLGVGGLGIHMGGHSNNARLSNRGSASASRLTATQISQANSGRQDAIITHFPPTPSLVQRTRRRGNAVPSPNLTRLAPPPTLLEKVSYLDAVTGTRIMRIRLEVLPPTSSAGEAILTRRLRTSEVAFQNVHHLIYSFILPENTSIVELLRIGGRAMEDGPGKFRFAEDTSTRASRHLPHETLSLQLLSLINKGNPRNNCVSYLTSRYPVSLNQTIGGLTDPAPAMRNKFGHPLYCIQDTDDGEHLIIRAAIRRHGARFTATDDGAWPRSHSCLTTRHGHLIDEATEDSLSEDEEDENMPEAPLALSSHRALGNQTTMTASTSASGQLPLPSRRALATQPVVRTQSLQEFGIPSSLFATIFHAQPGSLHHVYESRDILRAVYDLASTGRPSQVLEVEGTNLAEMVDKYYELLGRAADSNDSTAILSPRRNFRMLRPDGTVLSLGVGPEREVLYGVFLRFIDHPEKYFTPREQGRYAISTTISMAHRFLVSPVRIRELKILGAVLSLMLLHGMTPAPISPALFQFVFHGCNLNALTPEFLAEWYPELKLLLTNWVAIGPAGDLAPFQAHFSTYHDLQVSSLQSRDQSQHDAIGADMLYNAIFGSQPPSHPEYKALFSGMRMCCREGFDMAELFRSFPGGTERLLSQKWASHITGFASIEPNLVFKPPPAVDVAVLCSSLQFVIDPTKIFRDFLMRTGVPCPTLFDKARASLHPIVPLSTVDSEAFRPRMLAWATTGSPDSELSKDIRIFFLLLRELNMAEGTIAFASCFRTARIPLSYLINLHRTSYPILDEHGQPTEPLTLQDAIDNWLLIQIISNIGSSQCFNFAH
ncbi:hypothetical protein B0H12DRAFT_1156313 [Mycena haematopus]|nr:hypothetical protein B0H12DRAFT_1156313 [Mycena haematopus]